MIIEWYMSINHLNQNRVFFAQYSTAIHFLCLLHRITAKPVSVITSIKQ